MKREHPTLFDKILTEGFGSGLCHVAPGTAGSATAVLIWLLYASLLPGRLWTVSFTLFLTIVTFFLSVKAIDRVETIWGPDSPKVVIDEFIGQWIALLAVSDALSWWQIAAAFGLFRLFDITKPFGCGWIDRNVHGGLGVILDDVLAGIYSFTILFPVCYFWG